MIKAIRIIFGIIVILLVYGGIILSLLGIINPGTPYLMFE